VTFATRVANAPRAAAPCWGVVSLARPVAPPVDAVARVMAYRLAFETPDDRGGGSRGQCNLSRVSFCEPFGWSLDALGCSLDVEIVCVPRPDDCARCGCVVRSDRVGVALARVRA
jgi:hypothetical protein